MTAIQHHVVQQLSDLAILQHLRLIIHEQEVGLEAAIGTRLLVI